MTTTADHTSPCADVVAAATDLRTLRPWVGEIDVRVRKIEVRIAFIAGLSAAVGGGIGAVVGKNADKVVSAWEWMKTCIDAYAG